MSVNPRRRIASVLAALTSAAVVVPAALAERPDDRAVRVVAPAPTVYATAVRPDDRAARVSASISAADPRPASIPDDRAEARGPGAFFASHVPSTIDDPFQWADAAVGAAATAAFALLLAMTAYLVRRRIGPLAH